MADKTYKIEITANTANGNETAQPGQQKEDKSLIGQGENLLGALGILNAARSTYGYVTSRVGVETGNIQRQNYRQAAGNIASKVAIGALAIAGGPVTTVAFVISEGVQIAQQIHTYNYEKEMEGLRIGLVMERAGISRSRNTNQ